MLYTKYVSCLLSISCLLATKETPMHRIIARGNIVVADFQDIVGQQKNALNEQDNEGNTLLHLLANKPSASNKDMITFLLQQEGIDKTIRNNNGKTALDLAKAFFVEPSLYNVQYWEIDRRMDYDRKFASMSAREYQKVRDLSKQKEEEQRKAKEGIVALLSR